MTLVGLDGQPIASPEAMAAAREKARKEYVRANVVSMAGQIALALAALRQEPLVFDAGPIDDATAKEIGDGLAPMLDVLLPGELEARRGPNGHVLFRYTASGDLLASIQPPVDDDDGNDHPFESDAILGGPESFGGKPKI